MSPILQYRQSSRGTLDIYKHFQRKQHPRETKDCWSAKKTGTRVLSDCIALQNAFKRPVKQFDAGQRRFMNRSS